MLTEKEKFLIAAHDGQVEDKVYITGQLVKATAEIGRLRAALEEIERAGWKERLGAEGAIASHYEIRKIVRHALEQKLGNKK